MTATMMTECPICNKDAVLEESGYIDGVYGQTIRCETCGYSMWDEETQEYLYHPLV